MDLMMIFRVIFGMMAMMMVVVVIFRVPNRQTTTLSKSTDTDMNAVKERESLAEVPGPPTRRGGIGRLCASEVCRTWSIGR